MSSADSFELSLSEYTADYEVAEPDAEITDVQQELFFLRASGLASPAELEANFDGVEDLREEGFSEELILAALANLHSSGHYSIFGHDVWLNTHENLVVPGKTAKLHESRVVGSKALKLIVECDIAEVAERAEGGYSPHYNHRLSEIDRFKKTPEQMLIDYIFAEERLKKAREERAGETLEDFLARMRTGRNELDRTFTQKRWARAMGILNIIDVLQEIGITDTDDLN